jgi:hypothetical protein
MTGAGWHIRPGRPGDRELLASFACADPAVRWQAEVEQFIQAQLTGWAWAAPGSFVMSGGWIG